MEVEKEFVSYRQEEGIAWLTLSRPPLNVLHIPLLQQLADVLAAAAGESSVRVLVLGAEGRFFSAGVDVADHTHEKVGKMIPLFNQVCGLLAAFPTPTLAAVHGHALGGGCELVICCDLAIMAEGAKIGQPEVQLAAIAPIAALRLPQLVGYRAAADLLFSGRSVEAPEAARLGLVNVAVPAGELAEHVREMATRLAGLSRVALALTKRALACGSGNWAAALPAVEGLYLEDLVATADAHEGLAAFMEKRAPVWQHR